MKVGAEISKIENKKINRENQWNEKPIFGKLSETDRPLVRVTKKQQCVPLSVMSDSCDPWTVARQVPLSIEFSRQEYWSG